MNRKISIIVPCIDSSSVFINSGRFNSFINRSDMEIIIVSPDELDSSSVSRKRNYGAKIATGNFLFFFDDDCSIPDTLYFERALHEFNHAPDAILCGSYLSQKNLSYLGKSYNYMCNLWLNSMSCHVLGGNMAMTKSTFMGLGMFDESVAWGGEDTAFGYCAERAGVAIRKVLPGVYHGRYTTIFAFFKRAFLLGRAKVMLRKMGYASERRTYLKLSIKSETIRYLIPMVIHSIGIFSGEILARLNRDSKPSDSPQSAPSMYIK